MRHRHRRQPARREQAGFGRAHEQHAILARVTPEHLHGALLGSLIEIDQQVAAEHEVVGRRVGQQAGVEQIARLEAHPLHHLRGQLVAVAGLGEIAVPVVQRVATEGIAPVQAPARELDHALADVQRIDLEARGRHACVQQGHGDGIRLLAARTGQAQHAQHTLVGRAGSEQPLAGQLRHRLLRLRIAEEPGLGHDHRFDQQLHLGGRRLRPHQVVALIVHAGRAHAVAHGALDRGAPIERLSSPILRLSRPLNSSTSIMTPLPAARHRARIQQRPRLGRQQVIDGHGLHHAGGVGQDRPR